jgi:cysteine desulfuration protein SufE
METINDMCDYLNLILDTMNELEEIDYNEVYSYIIEQGNELPLIDEKDMIEKNKVKGCLARVYINSNIIENKIYFNGYADSQIVKGILAIFIKALNGLTPTDIVNHSEKCINDFLQKSRIKSSLTAYRSNTFGNIYCMIKEKASFYITTN